MADDLDAFFAEIAEVEAAVASGALPNDEDDAAPAIASTTAATTAADDGDAAPPPAKRARIEDVDNVISASQSTAIGSQSSATSTSHAATAKSEPGSVAAAQPAAPRNIAASAPPAAATVKPKQKFNMLLPSAPGSSIGSSGAGASAAAAAAGREGAAEGEGEGAGDGEPDALLSLLEEDEAVVAAAQEAGSSAAPVLVVAQHKHAVSSGSKPAFKAPLLFKPAVVAKPQPAAAAHSHAHTHAAAATAAVNHGYSAASGASGVAYGGAGGSGSGSGSAAAAAPAPASTTGAAAAAARTGPLQWAGMPGVSFADPAAAAAAATAAAHGKAGGAAASASLVRTAAGETWLDPTLGEWPVGDYRLFIGDLGKEVTDAELSAPFRKFASFAKAKIVIDKLKQKSRGYGFVSFLGQCPIPACSHFARTRFCLHHTHPLFAPRLAVARRPSSCECRSVGRACCNERI